MTTESESEDKEQKGPRLSQSDVPGYPLAGALRIAEALRDQYGKQPTRPLMVAAALKVSPTSGPFRMMTGAAVAYGVTDGAAQAEAIGLSALGRRIVSPTSEGDDLVAKREAVLRPRVLSEFLNRYDGNRLPNRDIALNVLEEMGVPVKATERAYNMIIENAQYVGFLKDINGNMYVNLDGSSTSEPAQSEESDLNEDLNTVNESDLHLDSDNSDEVVRKELPINDITTNSRVFITHGKNQDVVKQLKEVLTYGGLEPIVSTEREAGAKSVPDKVMDDMRSCGAGIVHVGADQTLLDRDGNEHQVLNPNVLIEIGAALALYNRNFILLVEKSVTLPSNLQGLYEVRYEGSKLDYEATMKLLRAFNEIKTGNTTV